MSTTTKITRIEDVRIGDDVTLTRDGLTVSGRVRPGGTVVGLGQWRIYFPGLGTLCGTDGWTLVSATREVPEWKPSTATVRGVKGVRVVRSLSTTGEAWWFTPIPPTTPFGRIGHWHPDCDVTDFVPDDAPHRAAQTEPAEVEKTTTLTIPGDPKTIREALCVAEGATLQNVDKRNLYGAREVLGALLKECDRHRPLGPDGKHGNRHTVTCGCDDAPERYRQRTEKAEAEVERLRVARTVPTRKQIVDAMWPDAPEGARVGLMDIGMVDRVLALIEQGGAS